MTRSADGADGRDADRPVRRASRRGVVAVGVAGLLAGCLVTSEEGGSTPRQTENGTTGGSDANDGGGSDGDETGSDGDGGGSDGGAEEATPDEVNPDGSGLVVTDATVRDVTQGGGWTRVRARLTVENAGRFEYGTIEFRADAYAVPRGSDEREAVGFASVTRRFPRDDRFDGTRSRSFEVTIRFETGGTPVRPDAERYAVDAAVRRAEPL
ncbi:hypothetical protein [Halorubrum ezzemoulense]|jgi:hypothetical protein|uniref:Uncharacterized protein n=1 Tax=Halorubrum ezzemoulense TaxID=337243 RepID=A0A256JPR6_HALEZ|nr:hypothetical protein [Halorubrum ezzemoulense]OYR70859.1 hypothetical protein DJ78_07335 [Halorubrum ezzemoulense]